MLGPNDAIAHREISSVPGRIHLTDALVQRDLTDTVVGAHPGRRISKRSICGGQGANDVMDHDAVYGRPVAATGEILSMFPDRLHALEPLSERAAEFIVRVLLLRLPIIGGAVTQRLLTRRLLTEGLPVGRRVGTRCHKEARTRHRGGGSAQHKESAS